MVMNNLNNQTTNFQNFAKGYKEASNELLDKYKVSLNAANAIVAGTSFVIPELKTLNLTLNAMGVLDDILEGNYWQSALGLGSMVAPLFKAYNPTITRYKIGRDVDGRITHTPIIYELGIPGSLSLEGVGITGDIYGFIVDDNGKIIQK